MSSIFPNYTFIAQTDAKPGDLILMWVQRAFQPYLVVRRPEAQGAGVQQILGLSDEFKCYSVQHWPKHILRLDEEWRFKLIHKPAAAHDHGFAVEKGKLYSAAKGRFLSAQSPGGLGFNDPVAVNVDTFEVCDEAPGQCVPFDWVIEVKDPGTDMWESFLVTQQKA